MLRARWRDLTSRGPGAPLGLALVVAVVTLAVVGPWLAPHDPTEIHADAVAAVDGGGPAPPGGPFPLGTDTLGRDLLSRLLHGGRTSLSVALLATVVAVALGLVVGVLAGFYGGITDAVAMRGVDVLLSLPFLLVAITVHAALGRPGLLTLALLLGVLSSTTLARVTRAKTLEVRALPFVDAARALGASPPRVLFAHVLPNVLGPVVVLATILVARMVLYESAMSYLGLGIQPPEASWGTLILEGQDLLSHAPRLVFWPGLLIVATVFGFNLLGESLRDALDPR